MCTAEAGVLALERKRRGPGGGSGDRADAAAAEAAVQRATLQFKARQLRRWKRGELGKQRRLAAQARTREAHAKHLEAQEAARLRDPAVGF